MTPRDGTDPSAHSDIYYHRVQTIVFGITELDNLNVMRTRPGLAPESSRKVVRSDAAERGVVLEVRHALFLAVTFMGSFYWTSVNLQIAPWRSLLVGVSAGFAVVLVMGALGITPMLGTLPTIALVASVAVYVELWHHRTYVRAGALVIQYGIWGNIRKSFPIAEVRDVRVSYPFLGHLCNVGDLDVLGYGWATTLPAVRRPEDYAQRIMALSTSARRDAKPREGHRAS